MESKRQLQVAEMIRRNMGVVLQQEGGYLYGFKTLVTVTTVKMSPDLSLAKIYLSVFNTENKQEPLLMINEELVKLRQLLGQRIKKHVRIIPHVAFYMDDTLDEMFKIDDMMRKLQEEGQMGDGSETE
jgi:ribosome-binding factor A